MAADVEETAPVPTLLVENDAVLRLIQVLFDREVADERRVAFADYFSHDLDDFEDWCARVRERAPKLWPSRVILVSSTDQLRDAIVEADGAIVEDLPIGEAELKHASKLKFVQKFGTVSRSLDPAACEAHGIPLLTCRRRVNVAVAEHTMALLFALAKKLNRIGGLVTIADLRCAGYAPRTFDTRHTANANWGRVRGLRTISGASLGLLGLGEIGREMARLGVGAGMEVSYFQRHRLDASEEARIGVTYRSLDELLARSEYLSVHVPLGPGTRDLIDRDALVRMKPGAILLNTSRAGIVNHAALVEALRSGHLGGAALDALYDEPASPEEPLLAFDNVILTPHLAAGPRWNELLDMEDMLAELSTFLS